MKKLFFKFCFLCFIFFATVGNVYVFGADQVLRLAMKAMSSYTFDNRTFYSNDLSFIMQMLGSGLVRMERDGSFIPALAESIDVSDDSMRYTFHLRDCCWSDGDPITAADFEYAWRGTHGKKYLYNNVDKSNEFFYAQDEKTFVVNLEFWAPFFFELLNLPMFYPVKDDIDNKKPGWQLGVEDYPCTGPFVIKSRDDGNLLVLKKNPLYWDSGSVKLEEVRLSFIDDSEIIFDLFLNGKIDWYGASINSVSDEKLAIYGLKKTNVLSRNTSMIHVNVERDFLCDKNFRKALYYALDRRKICEKILGGGDVPAATILLAQNSVRNRDDVVRGKNVQLARKFFDKALEDNGVVSVESVPKITLKYYASSGNNLLMEACQKQWQKVLGITIELIPLDYATVLGNNTSGDYDMIYVPLTCRFDNQTLIFSIFSSDNAKNNFAKWKNDKFLSLYWESKNVRDKESLNKFVGEMEDILDDEMPSIPLLYSSEGYLANSNLKDVFIPDAANLQFCGPILKRYKMS